MSAGRVSVLAVRRSSPYAMPLSEPKAPMLLAGYNSIAVAGPPVREGQVQSIGGYSAGRPDYATLVSQVTHYRARDNCRPSLRQCPMDSAASPCTDALRAAGWQPVEPLPCGCTPERLCAPHAWLRDAESWEAYLGLCASCLDTCTHTGAE